MNRRWLVVLLHWFGWGVVGALQPFALSDLRCWILLVAIVLIALTAKAHP